MIQEKIDYFNQLSEEERDKLYADVVANNRQIKNKDVAYHTFTSYKRQVNPIPQGYHQKAGNLTYVCKLRKGEEKGRGYAFTICDCGNWYITRIDSFKNGDIADCRAGKAISCGCVNDMTRQTVLNSQENIEKRAKTIQQNYIDNGQTPLVGETLHGWLITGSEMRTANGEPGKQRRYVTGICPYCQKESDWIRWDGIQAKHVISCGCQLSKGESVTAKAIGDTLTENNIPFRKEVTFDTCRNPKTNNKLKFDYGIYSDVECKNLLYLIEYDGAQHFIPGFGHTEEEFHELQQRDEFKTKWCKDNNIPLIRIPFTKRGGGEIYLEDLLLQSTEFLCD